MTMPIIKIKIKLKKGNIVSINHNFQIQNSDYFIIKIIVAQFSFTNDTYEIQDTYIQ